MHSARRTIDAMNDHPHNHHHGPRRRRRRGRANLDRRRHDDAQGDRRQHRRKPRAPREPDRARRRAPAARPHPRGRVLVRARRDLRDPDRRRGARRRAGRIRIRARAAPSTTSATRRRPQAASSSASRPAEWTASSASRDGRRPTTGRRLPWARTRSPARGHPRTTNGAPMARRRLLPPQWCGYAQSHHLRAKLNAAGGRGPLRRDVQAHVVELHVLPAGALRPPAPRSRPAARRAAARCGVRGTPSARRRRAREAVPATGAAPSRTRPKPARSRRSPGLLGAGRSSTALATRPGARAKGASAPTSWAACVEALHVAVAAALRHEAAAGRAARRTAPRTGRRGPAPSERRRWRTPRPPARPV